MKNSINNVIHPYLEENRIYISKHKLKSIFESEPFQGTLYQINQTFNTLGISNLTLQINSTNKNQVLELPTPFISHLEDIKEFILIDKIEDEKVDYVNESGKKVSEDWNIFEKKWSGIALLAFPESYKITKHTLNIAQFTQILLILTILLFFTFYSFTFYAITQSWLISALFITKTAGLTLSILLLQNEYYKDKSIVNRLCSVDKSDCNKVLESQDSKLFNFISWSELGFLYFSGSIFSLILSTGHNLNNTIMALFLINIPTLLFSFYSVWYQYYKAKSWCRFCLITIGLFWIEAILFWLTPSVFSIDNIVQEILLLAIGFGIPFTALMLLKPLLKKTEELKKVKKELNDIKYKDEVVDTLFKKNELKTETANSALLVNGETESPNIMTIITNPTCPPCAKLHKKLENYFNGCYDDLKINIIFTIDPENDKKAKKYKVAQRITQIYRTQGAKQALEAMDAWYNDKIFEKWDKTFPAEDIDVDGILKEQNDWCHANKIHYTPTIIFNNRELPKQYSIEDIKYLMV